MAVAHPAAQSKCNGGPVLTKASSPSKALPKPLTWCVSGPKFQEFGLTGVAAPFLVPALTEWRPGGSSPPDILWG